MNCTDFKLRYARCTYRFEDDISLTDGFIILAGRGIGGLVTGKLFDPASGIGDIWTFRLYGALSLLVLAVYVFINTAIFSRPILVPRNMSIEITAENTGKYCLKETSKRAALTLHLKFDFISCSYYKLRHVL